MAFDGIGSTALGTAVAVFLVLRTFKAERTRDRGNYLIEECRRIISDGRAIDKTNAKRGLEATPVRRWLADVERFRVAIFSTYPNLDTLLTAITAITAINVWDQSRLKTNEELLTDCVDSVVNALAEWLAFPDDYRTVPPEVMARELRRLQMGAVFMGFP